MRPQYNHDVLTSFVLWADNWIVGTGQAYKNVTGSLYRDAITGIPGYVYASPYRSWVWDSCVGGATIPSGFYASGSSNLLTAASGLGIDYLQGRVYSVVDRGPALTGTYARKEINIYPSTTEQSNYILEQLYNANINLKYPITGLYGTEYVAPLVMVTNSRGINEPWALGGMENTQNFLRCFIISNDNYIQEGVNSLLQDAAHTYISKVPIGAAPLTNVGMNATGTLKTPGWSYCSNIKDTYPCGEGFYVNGVYAFKLNERANGNINFMLSVVDVDLTRPRFPRA